MVNGETDGQSSPISWRAPERRIFEPLSRPPSVFDCSLLCHQVDPFFAEGVRLCREGGQDGFDLAEHVEATFQKNTSGGV